MRCANDCDGCVNCEGGPYIDPDTNGTVIHRNEFTNQIDRIENARRRSGLRDRLIGNRANN